MSDAAGEAREIDVEALAEAHHQDCILWPGSGVYQRDRRGWDAISPQHRDHHRAHVKLLLPIITAALQAAERAMVERAAGVFAGARCLGDHCEATDDGEAESLTLAHESDCPIYYLKMIRALLPPEPPHAGA